MDEIKYNEIVSKLLDEKIEAKRKVFSTLLTTFSAILAVNGTYGMGNLYKATFYLYGIDVFLLLMVSNAIGLLSCVILLYEKVDVCNQSLRTTRMVAKKYSNYPGEKIVCVDRRKIFSIFERVAYACFVLTVSFLVIYSTAGSCKGFPLINCEY